MTLTQPGSVEMRHPRARNQFTILIGLVVVLSLLPLFLGPANQAVAIRTLIFAIMAVGWNIMSGYGGMFSFGHAAFFGIGAYVDGYLLVTFGVSPWIAMIVAFVIAAAFGIATASLTLRYKIAGVYFALATFAFAQMLLLLVSNLDFLRKTIGFNIPIEPGDSWARLQFHPSSPWYYWIPLGLLALALALNILLVQSRAGQYVIAIRDDETAAESLGIPIMRYRLVAVALSCGITAVAGVYYAQYFMFVDPENAFGAHVSVEAIVPTVIGGIGTIWGPVIGAAIIGPLSEITSSILRDPPAFLMFLQGKGGLDVVLYAILLILIVLFLPRGVFGAVRARFTSRSMRSVSSHASMDPATSVPDSTDADAEGVRP